MNTTAIIKAVEEEAEILHVGNAARLDSFSAEALC